MIFLKRICIPSSCMEKPLPNTSFWLRHSHIGVIHFWPVSFAKKHMAVFFLDMKNPIQKHPIYWRHCWHSSKTSPFPGCNTGVFGIPSRLINTSTLGSLFFQKQKKSTGGMDTTYQGSGFFVFCFVFGWFLGVHRKIDETSMKLPPGLREFGGSSDQGTTFLGEFPGCGLPLLWGVLVLTFWVTSQGGLWCMRLCLKHLKTMNWQSLEKQNQP